MEFSFIKPIQGSFKLNSSIYKLSVVATSIIPFY